MLLSEVKPRHSGSLVYPFAAYKDPVDHPALPRSLSLLYTPAPRLHSLSSEKLELLRATSGQQGADPNPKRVLSLSTLTLVGRHVALEDRRLVFVTPGLIVLVRQGQGPRRVGLVVRQHQLEVLYPVLHGSLLMLLLHPYPKLI